nr:MAG: ORF1 [TTV-like mini virus]
MPFWRRPYRFRWRRRRQYWRRRPRTTLRRTLYRRRRRRVRRRFPKRKLKRIKIEQWQPPTIKKLTIKGIYQLFFTTKDRIENNNTMYIDETAPFHIPSGGGWSLSQFTLQNLFDQHLRLRNWWTKGNDVLPLIRYFGCTMYFYYESNVDYIVSYDTNYPLRASRLTYNGAQPSVMLLSKHRKIIPCKYFNRKKKPYKRVFIRPPSQLKNQWYFQHNFADIPLVNIMATAASLDRFYAHANAITTTIRFLVLDPRIWLQHNFKDEPTYGYQPQQNQPLFGLSNGHETLNTIKFEDLIYLGNAQQYGYGTEFKNVQSGTTETRFTNYFTDKTHWGNPFMIDYLDHTKTTVKHNGDINSIKEKLKKKSWNFSTTLQELGGFTITTLPNLIECRYNPHKDKGIGNEVYFLPITNNANYGWDPMPNKPELIAKDLPIWCLYWGLVDWQKRAGTITSIETHALTVFKTKYIDPNNEVYYIPLGQYFLSERSQYFPPAQETLTSITKADQSNWHPKLKFQLDVINSICQTGPATVKLPKDTSVEAHVYYKFHFKIGGAPPPMELVKDPTSQPIWTIPNNINETPSLQSPGTPFEHFLYNFDQRGEYLTQKAISRLKKDLPTKEIISSITGPTGLNVPIQKTQESDSETSEEEEAHQTLQQQLLKQQREQHKLRKRIQLLLNKLSTLE